MTGRLLCSVALVAHVFVLVICTDPVAQESSPTSETSPFDDSSNDISLVKQKKKCHRGPTTCGDNEVLANCPADCASDYCPTEETKESTFCEPQEVCPPPACRCAFNHRRASNGTCIPTRSCPPFDCSARPNEEFDPCPPLCPTDDCSQASPTGECPRLFGQIGIVLICNPQCRCKKGYWRLNGECVPYGQCPGVCPANERYSECIQGECRALNCTQKDQSVPCVRLDPKFCLKGCVCEEGYLRDENGVCVPQDQCKKETEPTTCPPNEQFTECTQIVCRAQKCEQKNWPIPCPGIAAGSCIKGCVCQDGYLRDDNGDCIPEDKCIPNPCLPSEEFSNCTQAVCRAQNCSDKDIPQACPSVADGDCKQGCVCQEGSLRDESGYCVPERLCRLNTCLFNEEWSSCVQSTCRAQNCTQKGLTVECPNFNIGDCTSGCICKENYLRDESGFCVPEESCDKKEEPTTCPPNEEFSKCFLRICRAQFCQDKGQDIPCPDIPEESCLEGCVCKEGYLRNKNGECIAENECSADLCTAHEEFSNCTQAVCRAQNCTDKGIPQACPSVADGDCKQGCICKEGYFRDKNGYCVPEELCSKECGTNQELRCMNSCPPQKTCSTRRFAVTCPPSPYVCKCVCKPGHVKDDNGQCIPEEQCDQLCSQNEEFSECVQATCRHQNCTQKGMPLGCPGIVTGDCKSGCICKENYLRDESGLCVPEEKCDEEEGPKTCPPNEDLVDCANALCRALNCRERGTLPPCPSVPKCIKGCVCKYGYLRDENGTCVPTEQCPVPTCQPNEEFSTCTQAICRAEYCSEKNESIPCPGIPEGSCLEGCVCREGFLRDQNGYCVPEELCDYQCGNNQEVRCVQSCPPERTCNNSDLAVSCAPSPCENKCVCRPGFVKDEINECIPEEECPGPCSENEVFSNCTQAVCRNQNCSDKDILKACPSVVDGDCIQGCVCQEGYFRDANGYCIPEDLCSKECGKNQELRCVQDCPPEANCGNRGIAVSCAPSPCDYKCVCKPGLIKDYNDECILEEQCDKLCPQNEEFSECVQATCRHQNCTQKGMPLGCPGIVTGDCKLGCICKENYLRDESGLCVPEEKCDEDEGPKTCPPNEDLVDCANALCRALNCRERGTLPPCPSVPKCIKGCVCKYGYLRDENGTCVPTEQCPVPTCQPNEEFSTCTQAICRAEYCSEKNLSIPCPGIPEGSCLEGCVCKEGFLRDQNRNCVPIELCDDQCGNNQEVRCVQSCPPERTCNNSDLAVSCAPSPCENKCVCRPGFVKDEINECIPEEECPGPCSENEEFSNCTQAVCRAQNCSDKDILKACPSVADGDCIQGCVCQEGYFRDVNGYCIPEDLCTKECGTNQELRCVQDCPPEASCGNRGIAVSCAPSPCDYKCVCKPGLIKDYNDECILEEQCDKLCPQNEEFSECVQATCRHQNCTQKGMPLGCPGLVPGACKPGCICKENYLRDESGSCVPEEECDEEEGPKTCPPNEDLVDCANALCRSLNCNERSILPPCPSVLKCIKDCVCKYGYLRDENGVCVPKEQCPIPTCQSNEEFSTCTQAICRAEYCSEKNQSIPCPGIPEGSCLEGCVCREGFLRDQNGYCVPEELCDYQCGNNQEVRCVQSCPPERTCNNSDLAVSCAPSPCENKCVCRPGFVKDEINECIPEEECPGPCSENEVFSNCTQAVCRNQNCSDKDILKACPSVADGDCKQGCVCQEGYFRDANGYCIPEDLCSKECGTNKELRCVQSCPPEVNCGNRDLAVSCAPSPCDYKCVCKPGLIKDYNDECIPEEQCDKLCPQNEEFSECVQATCRHQNCTQKGMPLGCPGIVTGDCKLGCICKENYLRDESGLCVPEEKCDEEEGPKTCPPNEDLVDCANALCRSLNCNERGILPPCPSVSKCIKDCVCKYGYLRDENGVCVPKEQCPVPTCPSNEQFSDCTQVLCRAQYCTEKDGPVFCPSISEGSCQEGCVCKEGYLRDDDGKCVAESECKAVTCPPNEEFSECANAVCRPLNCTHRGLFLPCPQVSGCDKECICKEGFLRDKNGDCVPEDQCPPQITCSENEVLDACPSKCTSDYCPKSPNEKETCLPLFPCTPACRCRFNEKRAENGTCIPTSSCPPFDCSDFPNEEYVACPPYCPTDECGQPRLKGRCPFRIGVVLECFPKCQCKEGYGRVNGTCIPFEECPDLCPANEEYSPCVEKTCRPQNCSERDTKIENCSPCTATPCHRGCVCKENYYRNEKGDCVPSEECEASLCPNANEVYTSNFKECPPNTCNSLVAKYKCDANQKERPGCLCASGYLRLNTTSPCIPLCDCPEMASSPDCLK
ncbi:zonadhesin isoform X2 [Helicoverpa armigera]|uniref:zonadhesin isoform X2 n=1 Tax=Helicoverpa armigera TaxID=29058 RepID=UPI003083AEC1